jgi:uncharacterized protein (DUF1330 family)
MTSYVFAHLQNLKMGPDIIEYLKSVDGTLEPFGGRLAVFGRSGKVLEGDFPGHITMLAFPDRESALNWYHSPAYQALLPLRQRHSDCDLMILDEVPQGWKAADFLAQMDRRRDEARAPE